MYSLFDLENYDPNPRGNRRERVFKCPSCRGVERSLHLNTETGLWNCKRFSCGATGRLTDFHSPKPSQSPTHLSKRLSKIRWQQELALSAIPTLAKTFSAPAVIQHDATHNDKEEAENGENDQSNWRAQWECAVCISTSSHGSRALRQRALNVDVAVASGVRFSKNWAPSAEGKHYVGGPAILYPLRDAQGQLRAVSGRYLEIAQKGTKSRVGGSLRQGAFFALVDGMSPLDRRNSIIRLVEGPACALSMANCGFTALAVGGCHLPEFLPFGCGLREVEIGSDCDDAGEKAAMNWIHQLQRLGARCRRLRADEAAKGSKDWNEALQIVGAAQLRNFLNSREQNERSKQPATFVQSTVNHRRLSSPQTVDWDQVEKTRRLLDVLSTKVPQAKCPAQIAAATEEIRLIWRGWQQERPDVIHRAAVELLCLRNDIDPAQVNP